MLGYCVLHEVSDSSHRARLLLSCVPGECYESEQSDSIPAERQARRQAKGQQEQTEVQNRKQSEVLSDLQTRQDLLVQLPLDNQERGRHEREFPNREVR